AHDHPGAALLRLVRKCEARGGVARALVHLSHFAREVGRGETRGEGDPCAFVLWPRGATHEAHLGPAEVAGEEGLLEARLRGGRRVALGEVAQLARGHPGALDGVVGEPGEPEPLPAARGHHLAGHPRECAPEWTGCTGEAMSLQLWVAALIRTDNHPGFRR